MKKRLLPSLFLSTIVCLFFLNGCDGKEAEKPGETPDPAEITTAVADDSLYEEPVAMVFDLGGEADIDDGQGYVRNACLAADLYEQELLVVKQGALIILMLGSGEKSKISAVTTVTIEKNGLTLLHGTLPTSAGKEQGLDISATDLSDLSDAIGNVGALRDIGAKPAPLSSLESLEEGTLDIGMAPGGGAESDVPEEREDDSFYDRAPPLPKKLGRDEADMELGEEATGFKSKTDYRSDKEEEKRTSQALKPGPRPSMQSPLSQPPSPPSEDAQRPRKKKIDLQVWTFNSFYNKDNLVIACTDFKGSCTYEFSINIGDNKVIYSQTSMPYAVVSKSNHALEPRQKYLITVRVLDNNT